MHEVDYIYVYTLTYLLLNVLKFAYRSTTFNYSDHKKCQGLNVCVPVTVPMLI
jgi:hypothetical protein